MILATLLTLSAAAAPQEPRDLTDRELLEELSAAIDRLERLVDERDAAASTGTDPADRLRWFQRHEELAARSPYADLRWQFLGPTNLSGRVTDVAVPTPRGDTYTIYVATASSGVWRTDNEGTTWEPILESGPTTSIGDVALDPSDPETLWVGTGEANIFRSSMAGAGVFLTRDGGETWEHKGLAGTHTIARVIVHPDDSDTVYVAASGHEWTDNPERGVFRTRDGGASWERVLFVDAGTGAIDLVMDPTKPERMYAATWERRRERWNDPRNTPTTDGSGVWRTEDGGDSWQPIVDGLPEPRYRGRIGIDLCAANPSVLYAFVDSYEPLELEEQEIDSYNRVRRNAIQGAKLYRSDDRGGSWRLVSEEGEYMQRLSATYGWVFGQMRVDPVDEDKVYVMGLGLNVSEDGGRTFRRLRGMHGDHHALWIDPSNTDYLVNGNDGGVVVSYDGGETWRQHLDNLPAVQFYNVGLDMDDPFRVYGSIQDHGSFRGVVDLSRGRDRIRPVEWERAPGGEASYHQIDPTDPDVVYSAGFYGSIQRRDYGTGERVRFDLPTEDGEERLRGQWLAPFLISPHNPRIVYHGMNRVFRTLDRGDAWEAISPDLSWNRDDRKGDIPYQTVATLSESPLRFGLLYAGTDDGRLHVTPDGGATWTEITEGLAENRWISRVEASRFDEDTVYAAQNGKRWDDFAPYLWVSRDRGETWRSLARGIPLGPINVVKEDPTDPDVLYVGTDVAVYVSTDRGASWDVLDGGRFPDSTYVHDLAIHPREDLLVAATHGRGVWVLDVRPIRGTDGEEEDDDDGDDDEPFDDTAFEEDEDDD